MNLLDEVLVQTVVFFGHRGWNYLLPGRYSNEYVFGCIFENVLLHILSVKVYLQLSFIFWRQQVSFLGRLVVFVTWKVVLTWVVMDYQDVSLGNITDHVALMMKTLEMECSFHYGILRK